VELSVLVFVIVVALFIRFAVALLRSPGASGSTERTARTRQAIEAMRPRHRTGPPPPNHLPQPPPFEPAPAPMAPPAPQPLDDADDVPTNGILNGPRLVTLTPDQQRRVLGYMEQGYEVMAVRLVCDETRAGILDAQKTVRTLAGLPSPY
jgi:hypothetical protein